MDNGCEAVHLLCFCCNTHTCRCLYLLTQHPEVEARILEERDRVIGNNPMTVENLGQCEYTKRVIMETLRLYPAGACVHGCVHSALHTRVQWILASVACLPCPYLVLLCGATPSSLFVFSLALLLA